MEDEERLSVVKGMIISTIIERQRAVLLVGISSGCEHSCPIRVPIPSVEAGGEGQLSGVVCSTVDPPQ